MIVSVYCCAVVIYSNYVHYIVYIKLLYKCGKLANYQNIFKECSTKYIQSLILSNKNILKWLLSHELTTMRHNSVIKNLGNLDAYLFFNWQSSNFLITLEIQSNLNLLLNGLYPAKSIECSSYKHGCTFSFIKHVLNKMIQFLPCHVLVLSIGGILNHIKQSIEERFSLYTCTLLMDTPCFQDGCYN